jgi:hypothetical protein
MLSYLEKDDELEGLPEFPCDCVAVDGSFHNVSHSFKFGFIIALIVKFHMIGTMLCLILR